MIFCFHMFWKSKSPKFYAPVIEKMKQANNKAFLNRRDLEMFVYLLRDILAQNKPEGHASRIFVSKGKEGGIYLQSGKVDEDIARLYFQTFGDILEYDDDEKTFFDVSERLLV